MTKNCKLINGDALDALRDMPDNSVDAVVTDPATVLQESMIREMNNQVGTGYMHFDQASQTYRPTWKGALLMTWKLIWPVSAIVRSRREAQFKDILSGI